MAFGATVSGAAQLEFEAASRGSLFNELTAILTGRQRMLLPLDDVVRAAGMDGQVDRGVHEVPLARIRGSENRTRDFDSSFHPLKQHLRGRWTRLYSLIQAGKEMPPIEVYRVGDVYFVRDGHHRVSIARRLRWETIRAHVVEIKTRAPLEADVDPEDLLNVAGYASFLERTHLDRTRPEARLLCSHLGRYDAILEHILGHRYFMSVDEKREVSLREAGASWYDSVYRPVRNVAQRHRLSEHLPRWTETDIYLALTRLWLDQDLQGQPAGPEHAADALLADAKPYAPKRRRRHRRKHRAGFGASAFSMARRRIV
jgi:ParB-like nuclease domain